MKKLLKQAVREHYETFNLDGDQLAQLKAMQRQGGRPVRRWIGLSVCAALLLLAFGFRFGLVHSQRQQLRAHIVAEVAANHLKREPVKHAGASVDDLRRILDRLNFHLSEPQLAEAQTLELLGGSYCSIQDHMAAQLQMRDANAQARATLYQVGLPQAWQHLARKPFETEHRGIKVLLWVENDVLFALASD